MPSLFPTQTVEPRPETAEIKAGPVKFGKSWRFDFDRGDFVMTPTGRVAEAAYTDAWAEWCKKALLTERYRYLVYSRNHGQEFEGLITRGLTRAGNELEIKRIATQCLMVDPRTRSVGNFTFRWEYDACIFSCQVASIHNEEVKINGSVVI